MHRTNPLTRRPAFIPTEKHRQTVRAMAAVGVPQDMIAAKLRCDQKTMRKFFREDLELAAAEATAQVGGRLYKLAMDGDVAACIFWMKARAGWREKVEHQHSMAIPTSLEERLAALEADPDEDGDVIDGDSSEISEGEPGSEQAAAAE